MHAHINLTLPPWRCSLCFKGTFKVAVGIRAPRNLKFDQTFTMLRRICCGEYENFLYSIRMRRNEALTWPSPSAILTGVPETGARRETGTHLCSIYNKCMIFSRACCECSFTRTTVCSSGTVDEAWYKVWKWDFLPRYIWSTHVACLSTLIAGLGGMAGARGTRTGTNAADCADMKNNTRNFIASEIETMAVRLELEKRKKFTKKKGVFN